MTYDAAYKYGKEKRIEQTKMVEDMINSKSFKNMTIKMKSSEITQAHFISTSQADMKIYGSTYAVDKLIEQNSYDTEEIDKARHFNVSDDEIMKFYLRKEKLMARSHSGSNGKYYTTALALISSGKVNKGLYKAYGIYGDKMELIKECVENGVTPKLHSEAMCKVMSSIEKADQKDSSMNRAFAATGYKIGRYTLQSLGVTKEEANAGVGLKKFGYNFDSLKTGAA